MSFKKMFCLCFFISFFSIYSGYAEEGYLWKVKVTDLTKLTNGKTLAPEEREFHIGNKDFYLESIKIGKCVVEKAEDYTHEMVELFEGHYGQRRVTCILPLGGTDSTYITSTILNCLTPYRRGLEDSAVLDFAIMDKVSKKPRTLKKYKIVVSCPKFNKKFHKK